MSMTNFRHIVKNYHFNYAWDFKILTEYAHCFLKSVWLYIDNKKIYISGFSLQKYREYVYYVWALIKYEGNRN